MNYLMIAIGCLIVIAIGLCISYSAYGEIKQVYHMWIDLYETNEYVMYWLVITDKIDGNFCSGVSNKTAGCTSHRTQVIQIRSDKIDHIDKMGNDIYLHEYLHARCEHKLWENKIYYNWHIDNDNPIFNKTINYWSTCGM